GGGPAGVYVANAFGGVSQYDARPDGSLRAKRPSSVAAGDNPSAIAITPDGRHVYVANRGGNEISEYGVGAGGRLRATATVSTGEGPEAIALSRDGKSAYVVNGLDNTLSQYDVGADGGLTPKTPATVKTGISPEAVAATP